MYAYLYRRNVFGWSIQFRILEDDSVTGNLEFPVEYEERQTAKSKIKRELYGLLSEKTKETSCPGGHSRGIRPTKIALTRLEAGQSEDEIGRFMEETYLTSREKIDLSIEIAGRERELLYRTSTMKTGTASMWAFPFCPDHLPVLLLHLLPHRQSGRSGWTELYLGRPVPGAGVHGGSDEGKACWIRSTSAEAPPPP